VKIFRKKILKAIAAAVCGQKHSLSVWGFEMLINKNAIAVLIANHLFRACIVSGADAINVHFL
jgi:hypothetical protein